MRMIGHCIIMCLILHVLPNRAAAADSEATMTSDWLADCSTDKEPQEIVARDEGSGCICRLKPDHHIVCYGATTCESFPKNVTLPSNVYDFRLKTTIIHKLYRGDLSGFVQLQRIDIDANFRLIEIEPGFFAGMSDVVNMSISFNTELRFLREETFDGLVSLRRLKLIKNGFRKILDVSQALTPAFLPRLQSLSLSENVFSELNETSFGYSSGIGLTELDMVLCQIEKIHPNTLRPFKKLEKLRLGENILKEEQLEALFNQMAGEGIPVKLLNLYELGFRKGDKLTSLLNAVAKLNVTSLNLRRNHIESIYEGLFPYMPELHTLDLREVSALDIELNALNESVMPKLKTLLLGGNKLSGVMPGVLLPQLLDLDLSANTGIDLLPSYFDVNSNIFENMTQLISLNISFNRLSAITNTTFNGVHRLRILGLKNATIFYIAKNSFRELRNLFLLNLEDNPLKPFNTFPDLIFEGLDRLEILLLSNCGISHFTRTDIFKSLTALRYLKLKGNNLIRIDPELFKSLPSLKGLDLSSNQLTPWDYPQSLFGADLKVLLLPHNRFTHLTSTMMDDLFAITRLDISGNPYVCDNLLFVTIRSWLKSRNLTWNETNLFDSSNICLSPQKWRDKPLIKFLVSMGAEVNSVSTNKRNSKYKPITYTYDAFVSYSHEDRNFVVRLVSKLENEEPYLKLCVYERDFEIGSVISEAVMNKVNASRKIVFIVSNAFAQSQWCIWELQIAEYHRVFFRLDNKTDYLNDSLIMIKLGPLMNCFVSPILKYILRTRIYLEWSSDYKKQKIFWDKLRHSLVANKRKNDINE
ncbi:UNVERIFIED_CONTAM: hypothetical protein PYX00_000135 [Menopon gallinae]|uniref:TIR domain-containing protein n=1 Tax=Menopon gallinae TaxID=328185 RepID=A0AAW2I8X1_9NEOP